jgi:uncharacterized membrane protein YcaP (DUF421 family)
MEKVLLQSTEALIRSFVLLVGSYAGLILVLRISGKRTLSKMNAFDLVVTVALGSTLATISLSKDTALVQGMLVLTLLVLLQFVVAWISVRSELFQNVVKARPTLLFHRGQFLEKAMKKERVTREEIVAAMRSQGIAAVGGVFAVVLETDGTFSVIKSEPETGESALEYVRQIE